MSNVKSNIRIKSNVYLRSPESISDGDHPEKDAAFIAQIFTGSALKKLKERAEENHSEIALSNIQQRILNGEKNIRLSELTVVLPEQASGNILSVEIGEQHAMADDSAAAPEMPSVSDPGNILSVEITTGQGAEPLVQAPESTAPADISLVQTEDQPEDAVSAGIASVQVAEQPEQAPENTEPTESPTEQAPETGTLEKISFGELLERGFGDEKTLISCKNGGYARYVSLLLHKSNIPHTLTNEFSAPAPVRHFADVLWDCNDKVITRDKFVKRFTARCSSEAARADECFDALCGLAGSAPSEGLNIRAFAEKIMQGGVSDLLFGERHDNITVAAADDVKADEFGKVYVLENGYDEPIPGAEDKRPVLLSIADCPTIVCGAGSFAALDGGGKAAVNLSRDDVEPLSFIGGTVGDAVRRQAYISQNVKCGDAIRLELNGGVYDAIHNNMVIAKTTAAFSERVLSEFGGTKYFDSLPQSLGDLTVTNITAVVSCRSPEEFGDMVPPQFRDRNFWLGVEISGFGSVN